MRNNNHERKVIKVKVFDVSEYQPADRVQDLIENRGAEGIIVRIGETSYGTPHIDEKFYDFAQQVIDAGLPIGFYYASHARNADEFMTEARFINDRVYAVLQGGFPELGIWWDVEVPALERDDMWPQLCDIIGTMEGWYNDMRIGVYTGYSFFNQWINFEDLAQYNIPVWVAQYGYHENSLKEEHPELHHVAWQYTTECDELSQDVNDWYGFNF